MNPTKVAVIGCGQIATSKHLPAWQETADAGVCSLSRAAIRRRFTPFPRGG